MMDGFGYKRSVLPHSHAIGLTFGVRSKNIRNGNTGTEEKLRSYIYLIKPTVFPSEVALQFKDNDIQVRFEQFRIL